MPVAILALLIPSAAYGAVAPNSGFSYTFTSAGVSNTVNWNNAGLGDFMIVDGSTQSASGGDAYDNGALIDICSTANCNYTSAFNGYVGVGTAASSTLYQGATVNNIVAGLNMSVSYRFSQTSASVRILVKLDNTTASPLTRTIRLRTGLGCDSGCYMKYQSSGGSTLANYFSPSSSSYTTTSFWTIQSDNSGLLAAGSGSDPIVSFAYGSAGTGLTPTTTITNAGGDNLFTTIDPTIPANSTRYLVFIAGLGGVTKTTNTLSDAYSGVSSLFGSWDSLASDIKSDLSSTQLGQILNWSIGATVSTFNSNQASPTNTLSGISYSLTMSQSVSGLSGADFTNAGTAASCTFASDTSTGTSFVVTATGCSEGTLRPQLLANSVSGVQAGPPADSPASTTIMIDRTSPTISSVSATNGNYSAQLSPNINFTVSFSESVTVSGTPRIPITIGTTSRFANYVSMSDSRTALFRFAVTSNYDDIDLNGIEVTSPLDLNSGAISDLAANSIVSLTFIPPVTTSVNVYQPPSAPVIESITANNGSVTVYFTAPTSNGSTISNYKYSLNSGSYLALSPIDAASPITITGLTNGTAYQIAIRAVSNLGDGLASNALSSTPSASASVTISLTASAVTATKGTTIVITASVSQAGVVTFFWNAKRIAGCINRPVTSSATCNWKPAVTGNWAISALLDPTDPTFVNSSSNPLSVFITKRSNTR